MGKNQLGPKSGSLIPGFLKKKLISLGYLFKQYQMPLVYDYGISERNF